jgi:hypothetical protein
MQTLRCARVIRVCLHYTTSGSLLRHANLASVAGAQQRHRGPLRTRHFMQLQQAANTYMRFR